MRRPEAGPPQAVVIAVLGAESTGKTALAQGLAQALQPQLGLPCTWVDEWLRRWCDREGRTPLRHEQAGIAGEQSRRIAQACQTHRVVVADTTALMTAVYSQLLFDDRSLIAPALQVHRGYGLTLVTDNDIPWQADGLQRDGPQVREPVRALLLDSLREGGITHHAVQGQGPHRLAGALQAIGPRLAALLHGAG